MAGAVIFRISTFLSIEMSRIDDTLEQSVPVETSGASLQLNLRLACDDVFYRWTVAGGMVGASKTKTASSLVGGDRR